MDGMKPPAGTGFATGTGLFLRTLAACHGVAFGSYWLQAKGLVGPSGILPAGQYLAEVRRVFGARAWADVPSLCWIVGTHPAIDILCAAGCVLSVLLFLGWAQAPCLAALWCFYLSLVCVGQIFYAFQWDTLLLEATLVAVFLVPWTFRRVPDPREPPVLARALVWWLLFRLMFQSGFVKLQAGDPAWRGLTALTFHYETQPLPSPLAWYAHQLPLWTQKASCAFMFAVELAAPLCLVLPRRIRHPAVLSIILLQVLIALTGNYTFFNLLSVGLCLTCLDDGWWRSLHWGSAGGGQSPPEAGFGRAQRLLLRWFAAFAAGVTILNAAASVSPAIARSRLVQDVDEYVSPLESFNDYGLFRVMTRERPELVIEGSNDGNDWREYSLPYKPGDLRRRPSWVAPYQPRLDWQLWFAALGNPEDNVWVETLCERLLRGDRAVLGLFARNPFPDRPPRYLRVVRYRYEFTSFAERARTGNWWSRTPMDFYITPISLKEAPL
jgi:hypothetical protein